MPLRRTCLLAALAPRPALAALPQKAHRLAMMSRRQLQPASPIGPQRDDLAANVVTSLPPALTLRARSQMKATTPFVLKCLAYWLL